MKFVIVGSGIGGLLSGALAKKAGHEVVIIEKMKRVGGRFTNFDYAGFQLSTGAFHVLPSGENGPVAKIFEYIGIDHEIVNTKPRMSYMLNGKIYEEWKALKGLGIKDSWDLVRYYLRLKIKQGENRKLSEVLDEKMSNKAKRLIDAIIGWSVSVTSEDLTEREATRTLKLLDKYKGPGVPKGGCKGLVDKLVAYIGNENIRTGEKVVEIDPFDNVVHTETGEIKGDVIISNVGPKHTLDLIGEKSLPTYETKKIKDMKSAEGIKYNIGIHGQVTKGGEVVITPDFKYLDGFNEPSVISHDLAPKGMNLVMVHQAVKKDMKTDLKEGTNELVELFKDYKWDLISTQSYSGEWPVNRAAHGSGISQITTIDKFYMVGDGTDPMGFVEVEGIAAGVIKVFDHLGIVNAEEVGVSEAKWNNN